MLSLEAVNGTLGRLLLIELAVGAATLSGLALLALWLVCIGLRPIETVADAPVMVRGGGARLRQVVGNLLSDARAHTPPSARVVVRTLERG